MAEDGKRRRPLTLRCSALDRQLARDLGDVPPFVRFSAAMMAA